MSRYTIEAISPQNVDFAITQARRAFRDVDVIEQQPPTAQIEIGDFPDKIQPHFLIFLDLLGAEYFATKYTEGKPPVLMMR